jgi:hypothetical protein
VQPPALPVALALGRWPIELAAMQAVSMFVSVLVVYELVFVLVLVLVPVLGSKAAQYEESMVRLR